MNKKRFKTNYFLLIVILCLTFGLLLSVPSSAGMIILELDYEYSGADEPEGEKPWLTAIFDDNDTPGTVTLTMDATNLTGAEYVIGWYFNYDDDYSGDLDFTYNSSSTGPPASSIGTTSNDYMADGDGSFDILFSFPTDAGSRFGAMDDKDIVIYDIVGDNITAETFNFLSQPGLGDNPGPFLSAAHIGGIGPGEDNSGSGWIAVPEPSIILLLGSLLIGLGLVEIRRKRF